MSNQVINRNISPAELRRMKEEFINILSKEKKELAKLTQRLRRQRHKLKLAKQRKTRGFDPAQPKSRPKKSAQTHPVRSYRKLPVPVKQMTKQQRTEYYTCVHKRSKSSCPECSPQNMCVEHGKYKLTCRKCYYKRSGTSRSTSPKPITVRPPTQPIVQRPDVQRPDVQQAGQQPIQQAQRLQSTDSKPQILASAYSAPSSIILKDEGMLQESWYTKTTSSPAAPLGSVSSSLGSVSTTKLQYPRTPFTNSTVGMVDVAQSPTNRNVAISATSSVVNGKRCVVYNIVRIEDEEGNAYLKWNARKIPPQM